MEAMQLILVIFGFVFFVFGSTYHRWSPERQPYYPSIVSLGLACITAGVWLIPMAFHTR